MRVFVALLAAVLLPASLLMLRADDEKATLQEAAQLLESKNRDERAEGMRKLTGLTKYRKTVVKLVLGKLLGETDEDVKDAAFEVLRGLDDAESKKRIMSACKIAKDPDIKAQLLKIIWTYKDPKGDKQVLSGLNNKAWEIRLTAAELLASARREGSKRDIEFVKKIIDKLIVVMPIEPDGRVKNWMRAALYYLTGRDFSGDEKNERKKWRQWWKKRRDLFGQGGDKPADKADVGSGKWRTTLRPYEDDVDTPSGKVPRFFGEEIKKSKVCFVIDVSGSMSEQSSGGKAKLELVRDELIKTIQAMDKRYSFNVITYSTGVAKWRDGLQKATPENKQAAIDHVKRFSPMGMTNIYAAMKMALEDPDVSLIVLLSDGLPTVGVTDTNIILNSVRKWNRYKRIQINTVGMQGCDQTFMTNLATQNKGKFKMVQ